ncbi:MAG: helix-turn-helix domain-containing protein [Acidimicrobiales bacterium]|nr:helix-turn-helix transcriptional regulator [Acidimicrobiales bacterium]MCB1262815.1 helix-turn-helix transcriptional regulator [Acidimicrobiales bacterium]
MLDLEVIDAPDAAIAALDPVRAQILRLLVDPGSATSVARILDLPRQKVNYHLRALEAHGLVELVEERPRRGATERIVQATARGYLVSPAAIGGDTVADPQRVDRLSSRYLVALAARVVREVSSLARNADAAGKSLPTLAIDTEVRFASAADRAAFTAELAEAVTSLVARYHDEQAPGGRPHRVLVAAHPTPPSDDNPRSDR